MNPAETVSYAGFGRRAAAALLDSVLLLLIFTALDIFNLQSVWLYSLQTLTALLYCGLFWIYLAGTPGKLVLGCLVVDAQSQQRLGWRQVLLRFFGYYVSQFVFFLGFLWVLWDAKGQGFHDKMARSVVLYRPDLFEQDESQKSLQQLVSELR